MALPGSQAPTSTAAGSAWYIGRIGALAVALGIGAAVATSPGAAFADPSSDDGSSATSDGPRRTPDGPARPTTDKPAKPTPATTSDSGDGAGGTDGSDGTDSSTSATDAGDDSDSSSDTPGAGSDRGDDDGSSVTRGSRRGSAPKADKPTARVKPSTSTSAGAERPKPSATKADTSDAGPSAGNAPAATVDNTPVRVNTQVDVDVDQPVAKAQNSGVKPASAQTVVTALPDDEGLSPLATDAPEDPESPAMWVLAAAARRQLGGQDDRDKSSASAQSTSQLLDSSDGDAPGLLVADDIDLEDEPGQDEFGQDEFGQDEFVEEEFVEGDGEIQTMGARHYYHYNRDPKVTKPPTVNPPDPVTGVVTGKVYFSDPDGDKLSYHVDQPSTGTVVVDKYGNFTYTPTAAARHNAAGTPNTDFSTFSITADDGRGGCASTPVKVTVAPKNTAPVVTATPGQPGPGGKVIVDVTATDADGDHLSYFPTKPPKGNVTVTQGGDLVYTPTDAARHDAAKEGRTEPLTDTFTLTVKDGHGGVTSIPVTVVIAPANAAPTMNPVAGNPDPVTGKVVVNLNGNDEDCDDLTYTASQPQRGTVQIVNGKAIYTPTDDARHAASQTDGEEPQSDFFYVTADDGHGGEVTKLVTVQIAPTNENPTLTVTPRDADPQTGAVELDVDVDDADDDDVDLTYGQPFYGELIFDEDGKVYYQPSDAARHAAARQDGEAPRQDRFYVTADDGHGGVTEVLVTVDILPSNQAPTGTVTPSDPDPDTGRVDLDVVWDDPDGDWVDVRYGEPQYGQIHVDDWGQTQRGQYWVGEGGGVYYKPTDAARHAAATADGPKTDTFTVTFDDGHGGVVVKQVTVQIAPANDDPTLVVTPYDPDEDGDVYVHVSANDDDNDPLDYDVSTPAHGEVTWVEGGLVYRPTDDARHNAASTAPGAITTDSFTITVDDGHGGTVTKLVTVQIAPANQDPTLTATPGQPGANGDVTVVLDGNDPDGDDLTYSAGEPAYGSVRFDDDGNLIYTPTDDARHAAASDDYYAPKQDYFTVTVDDGHGGTKTVEVVVDIAPANTPPIGNVTVHPPDPDTGIVDLDVDWEDPDGDYVYVTYGEPQYGQIHVNDWGQSQRGQYWVDEGGGVYYKPTDAARHAAATADGPKTDTFTVTFDDGHGGVVVKQVTVQIAPANIAPTLEVNPSDPDEDGDVYLNVSANDGDNDPLDYDISTPAHGEVFWTEGGWVYRPTDDARHNAASTTNPITTDSFTITVDDGHGGVVSQLVTVKIAPANDPPSLTATPGQPSSNGDVTVVLDADDPDGDDLTYSAGDPAYGSVRFDEDGNLVYTPTDEARHAAADEYDPYAPRYDYFTVTVDDGHGGRTTTEVRVDILPANDAPTVSADVYPPDEDGNVFVDIIASDPDGDDLGYSVGDAQYGTVGLDDSNNIVYTPTAQARHAAATANGPKQDTFVVTVDDGHGGITELQVTVDILPANQDPTLTVNPGQPNQNGQVEIDWSATDPDQDDLVVAISQPTNGRVFTDEGGRLVYVPSDAARHAAAKVGGNAPTTDSFTITVDDGHGGIVTKVVTVDILPQNEVPTVVGDIEKNPDSGTGVVSGRINSVDPDGDVVKYSGSTTTGKGTLVVNEDGTFTYTPTDAARFAAGLGTDPTALTDNFTVVMDDGYGGVIEVPVSVDIVPLFVVVPPIYEPPGGGFDYELPTAPEVPEEEEPEAEEEPARTLADNDRRSSSDVVAYSRPITRAPVSRPTPPRVVKPATPLPQKFPITGSPAPEAGLTSNVGTGTQATTVVIVLLAIGGYSFAQRIASHPPAGRRR